MTTIMVRNALTAIPFVHLLVSIGSNWITWDYYTLGNLAGYSLLTNLFMGLVIFRGRFCIYSKMAVIALILMNLVCLLEDFINYNTYAKMYDLTTVTVLTVVCLIIYFKRWYNMRA